ncbi:MAG: PKD domain-containing protein [Gemmatimonadaceae bacterium]
MMIAGQCGSQAAVWFRFSDGTITVQLLDPLPGSFYRAVARGINPAGDVVGYSQWPNLDVRATQWGVTVPDVPPVVSLTLPSNVAEGQSAQLNATSHDPNGNAVTFDWDFGDGSPHGNGCCPSHTWTDNGSYTVTVTSSDGTLSASESSTLQVSNVAPTATFNAPTGDVTVGTAFQLQLVNPVDPGAADVSAGFFYSFDCGGGTLVPSTGASIGCTAPNTPGTITVRGKILDKDSDGTTYTATVTITPVPNQAPVVQPIQSAGGPEGSSIQFSVAATDPEGQPLTYDWDFGDGAHGSGASPTHAYNDDGTVPVSVTVSDGVLTTTVSTSVVITNAPPTATLDVPATPVTIGVPFTIALTNATDPSPVDAGLGFQYAFDCEGDGTFTAYAAVASTNCTINTLGTHTVGARIADTEGSASAYTAQVVVQAPPNQPPGVAAVARRRGPKARR